MRHLFAFGIVCVLEYSAAAAPQVRDEPTKKVLAGASTMTMDARGYFGNGPNAYEAATHASCTPEIAETCVAMWTDKEPRVRAMVADCVHSCSVTIWKAKDLMEPAIDAALAALEKEPHGGVALHEAYALSSLYEHRALAAGHDKRMVKLVGNLLGGDAVQAEAARKVIALLGRKDVRNDDLTLSLLGDSRREVVSAALGMAEHVADQAKVCKALAPQLRASVPAWFETAGYVLTKSARVTPCDELVEPAIDLVISQSADNPEPLALLENLDQVRPLPAATRKRIVDRLTALRGRGPANRDIYDHVIAIYKAAPVAVRGK